MATHSVWRGFLTFGLLSMPVKLFTAARDKRVELNNFHTACNTQIKMPKYCPKCDVQLQPTEIYKGFNTGSGIVRLTEDEMDGITPDTERAIEINECVKWNDVDPVYLAESYYLAPETPNNKAYALLVKTLTDSGLVAITQITKNSREHIAVIRPKGNGLMLHYLWYANEVAQVAEFQNIQPITLSAKELKLAKDLAENMQADFDPSQYEDGYLQRLNTLIASKLDKKIAAPTPVKASARAETVDIASALEASLLNRPNRRRIKPQEAKPAKGKKVA
jgi:DNA end-binding protein Ku